MWLWIIIHHGFLIYLGPILESKGMHANFPKRGKEMAKYLKIQAKMYKIWKYFEKGQVIGCDYRKQ